MLHIITLRIAVLAARQRLLYRTNLALLEVDPNPFQYTYE